MKQGKFKFTYVMGEGTEIFPDDFELGVEFNEECTLDQVVEGFKMFLLGVGYSPSLVEGIGDED